MAGNGDTDREIRYEIVEPLGVIAAYSNGWQKELNLVSWNGGNAKYDIRDWDPNHEHMSRGVTLHEKEMRLLTELYQNRPAAASASVPDLQQDAEGAARESA